MYIYNLWPSVSSLTGLGRIRNIDRPRLAVVVTTSRLISVPVRRTKTWSLGLVQLFLKMMVVVS